jgi:hypothetical protein
MSGIARRCVAIAGRLALISQKLTAKQQEQSVTSNA